MIKDKKIGLGIVAFDACEHLINIISELEGLLDYVVIGLQKVSYHGKPISKEDLYMCEKLVEDKLVDKIIYIETDLTKFARHQEVDKRNLLLDDIQNNGQCDYAFIIDSDEFYQRRQFENAVNKIINNDFDITYCRYVNYFGDYKHYLVYPFKDGCYVPFVSKSDYRYAWECKDFTKPSDPTRRYVRKRNEHNQCIDKLYEFQWSELNMHHLSWIRWNISSKLDNWSSKKLFNNFPFLSDKSIEVYNNFLENPANVSEATLLFNTPGNKVTIAEWPKQYINPKYDIHKVDIPEEVVCSNDYNICILVNLDYSDIKETPEDTRSRYINTYNTDSSRDIRFYTSKYKNLSKKYNDIIYIDIPKDANKNIIRDYTKLVKSLINLTNKKNYDYIIKIDPDTWINMNYINYAISHKLFDRRCIYGANKIKSFHTKWNPYISDEGLILSDICVYKITSTYNKTVEKEFPNSADILIGAVLNTEYKKVGLQDLDKKWVGLDICYGFEDMDEDIVHPHREFFVKALHGDLNKIWNSLITYDREFNILDILNIKDKIQNEQQCIDIELEKDEWIKNNLDSYRKSDIYNNMKLFNNPTNPQIY